MKVTETTSEFTDAMNTVNKVIQENRDDVPFGPIIKASEKVTEGIVVNVGIYKDDENNPYDYYAVRFHDGQFNLIDHGKDEGAHLSWYFSQKYIHDLANDPKRYLDNPLLLDWDWLKNWLQQRTKD